jgi:hypothetical protein
MFTRVVDGARQVAQMITDVTTSTAWRWTVGRVSCAAKVVVYAVGTILFTGKVVAKDPYYHQNGEVGEEEQERDYTQWKRVFYKCVENAFGIMAGPGFSDDFDENTGQYESVIGAVAKVFDDVFVGSYHPEVDTRRVAAESGKSRGIIEVPRRLI